MIRGGGEWSGLGGSERHGSLTHGHVVGRLINSLGLSLDDPQSAV